MQPFSLKDLVLYFLKLGATGFGGPIALIGYMEKDLVEKKKWFAKEDYLNGLALAQIVPGPLAVQLAIYLGYLKQKIWGATLVGIVFVLPSFLLVLALSYFYVRFQGLPWIGNVFYGMGAAVIAIIVRTAWRLAKITLNRKVVLWIIFFVLMATTIAIQKASFLLFMLSGFFAAMIYAFPKSPKFRAVLPLEMYFFFFKAAIVVFGSGMAVIPFIYGDVVEGFGWLTRQQFMDAVSIGMITPGPVLITVAFIGYLVDGLKGALASAIGVFTPVYLFVIIFSPFFHKIVKNIYVKNFVLGVTAAAAGAIAGSVVVLGKGAIVDWQTALIALTVLVLILKTKIPEPLLIVAGALIGFGLKTLI